MVWRLSLRLWSRCHDSHQSSNGTWRLTYKYYLYNEYAFWDIEALYNGRHFADDIFKRISFISEFNEVIQMSILAIIRHQIRWWLVAKQATRQYLKQWSSLLLIGLYECGIRPQWINKHNHRALWLIMDLHNSLWISIDDLWISVIELWASIIGFMEIELWSSISFDLWRSITHNSIHRALQFAVIWSSKQFVEIRHPHDGAP